MSAKGGFLKTLGNAIRFCLFRLGLWVPLCFTILFFVVLALSGTPFAEVKGVYVFGLIATVLFAFVFVAFMISQRIQKAAKKIARTSGAPEKAKRRRGKISFVDGAEKNENVRVRSFFDEPAMGTDAQGADTAERAPAARDSKNADFSAPEPRRSPARDEVNGSVNFFGYDGGPRPTRENDGFVPYDGAVAERKTPAEEGVRFLPYDRPRESAAPRDAFADIEERPRIFRTRLDPDILIYEYSDRLEFYRTEGGKRTFLSSEPKKGGFRG